MNSTSPDVIANDVEHLTRRVAAMEAKQELRNAGRHPDRGGAADYWRLYRGIVLAHGPV